MMILALDSTQIILTVIGIISIVAILALAVVWFFNHMYDGKSKKQRGGIQIGGDERISFFSPNNEKAGKRGEKTVNHFLRLLLKEDEYILVNVLLPLKNGNKTEIDCIIVSRKGIFCIETKNWVGHIFGSDNNEYWYQQYDDPYKNAERRKNPVKQNEAHCNILYKMLNERYDINNIVIFADLDSDSNIDSDYTFSLDEFVDSYPEWEDEITIEEVKQISQELRKYVATPEQLRQYRKEMEQLYKD